MIQLEVQAKGCQAEKMHVQRWKQNLTCGKMGRTANTTQISKIVRQVDGVGRVQSTKAFLSHVKDFGFGLNSIKKSGKNIN